MRLSKSWVIARKDFKVFSKKKNIIYSLVVVPLMVSILFPVVIELSGRKSGGIPAAELTILLPAFTVFYVILAGITPTTLASYSLVGEKVEKSLEPLLATPTTDSEILLGKGIAATIPPMAAILAGSAIFMGLTDAVTSGALGYNYFPNWNAALVLFLMVPLATAMSIEWNVLVSSRVSDVRIAQQLGAIFILPYAGIYVSGELKLIDLGQTSNLLIICASMGFVVLLMLYVVQATFQREAILTRWK